MVGEGDGAEGALLKDLFFFAEVVIYSCTGTQIVTRYISDKIPQKTLRNAEKQEPFFVWKFCPGSLGKRYLSSWSYFIFWCKEGKEVKINKPLIGVPHCPQ